MNGCRIRRKPCGMPGVTMRIETVDTGDAHPNTYRLTLRNARGEQHTLIAISTGGGMMEVINIDGFAVSLFGDYHETLLSVIGSGADLVQRLAALAGVDEVLLHEHCGKQLVQVKAAQFLSDETIAELRKVCPILSGEAARAGVADCFPQGYPRAVHDLRGNAALTMPAETFRCGSWRWNMKWRAAI